MSASPSAESSLLSTLIVCCHTCVDVLLCPKASSVPWHPPVVALGQLVGHGREGQRAALLGPQRVVDPAAVHQAPPLALQESLHQDVIPVLLVQPECLQDTSVTALHHPRLRGTQGVPTSQDENENPYSSPFCGLPDLIW